MEQLVQMIKEGADSYDYDVRKMDEEDSISDEPNKIFRYPLASHLTIITLLTTKS
jgi:hypothetical protein